MKTRLNFRPYVKSAAIYAVALLYAAGQLAADTTLTSSDNYLSSAYVATSNVDYQGSTLYIGFSNSATLTVNSGVQVTAGIFEIAYEEQGTCIVDGGTIKATGNNFNIIYVGDGSSDPSDNGLGTLIIKNGGTASCKNGIIAKSTQGSGSAATISGANSKWTCSAALYVGYAGSGSLGVTDGGALSDVDGYVAYGSTTGNATISGGTWTNSGTLYVGYAGSGSLDADASSTVSTGGDAYISYNSGASGSNVSISDSTLSVTGNLHVGYGAAGALQVKNGGVVTSVNGYISETSGVTAGVTVEDAGSEWTLSGSLYAGYAGKGTLDIESGATVSAAGAYIACTSVAAGSSITVDGGTLTLNALHVGYSGEGTLDIGAGGNVSVTSTAVYVGENSLSKGTINVAGSGASFSNSSGALDVGEYGNGALNVSTGGSASAYKTYVAYQSGSTGSVTVSGNGSSFACTNDLVIGYQGAGTITVSNSGNVSCASCYLGGITSASTGSAALTGSGSRLECSGTLYVGYLGTGTLTIEKSALVVTNDLSVQSVGRIYIGGGYLVIAGDKQEAIYTLLNAGNFYAPDNSGTYVALNSGNYSDYISVDCENLKNMVIAGYSLSGTYTIVTSTYSVPEPAACALLAGLGAIGLALFPRGGKTSRRTGHSSPSPGGVLRHE